MENFAWLAGHSFQSLAWREFDWVFQFSSEVTLTVECLWRLVENGRVRFTSTDHGQQFGLPAPVDAASEVNQRLTSATINAAKLREGTLDLELQFSTGHRLQIVPDSSGYEAWNICGPTIRAYAIGGGDLSVFSN
jgi:hypothetical protein